MIRSISRRSSDVGAGTIAAGGSCRRPNSGRRGGTKGEKRMGGRSEEHTSELQSLMRISYAVFCLKKKKKPATRLTYIQQRQNNKPSTTDIIVDIRIIPSHTTTAYTLTDL